MMLESGGEDHVDGSASFIGVPISPDTLVGAIVFLPLQNRSGTVADITAVLVEQSDRFDMGFRIRIYMDDKVHSSNDPKLFSHRFIMKSEKNTRSVAMSMYDEVIDRWRDLWKIDPDCKVENLNWIPFGDVVNRFKENPPSWMHIKKIQQQEDGKEDGKEYPNQL